MEVTSYVTEADINAKLAELRGKVPSVIINDLREKLLAKKDELTPEHLDRIVKKTLEVYGNQFSKYEQINKKVDEMGKRLNDLSAQLSQLLESLEEAKYTVYEKRAENLGEKVEEVKEKVKGLGEKLEKVEEIKEEVRGLHEKLEASKKPEESKVPETRFREEERITPEVVEEKPVVEEIPSKEEVHKEEEVHVEAEETEEQPEVEVPEEKAPTGEVVEEETPQEEVPEVEVHEEEFKAASEEEVTRKSEGGEVEMAEGKIEVPEEFAKLLFEEEPKNYRLKAIPEDMVSTMIALKWLGFLIDRVGIQNLENVLEFYYEIGWISENVLNTLLRYAKGTRPHHRDPEWKPAEKLTVQDHLISLLFIERLRGLRINRDVLDKLEREIKTLEKTLDEFYGV
ncbi:flagellar protein D [Thermococcus sp. P6]|uniref:FlaD/FlaE family flagellar protein n=1 Tax=Thermococcus sp. P6 TaxID=122420 RepID=UPI000B59FD14|nr:FlaD/FlaE family flagellar protein [Thermococcus sp. P6]ASJ11162.1 flagellar protein D [Thermococcus sp. P6]